MLFISYSFNFGDEYNYYDNVILDMDKPKSKEDIERLQRVISKLHMEDDDESPSLTILFFQTV
jgi:hypothetical protein